MTPLSTAQVSQSQRSHFCFWVPVRACSSMYFPVFRGSLVTSSFRAAFGCVRPPTLGFKLWSGRGASSSFCL